MNRYIQWSDTDTFKQLNTILAHNGVFIGTTDTVLGLFATANQAGFEALNALKGRERKPYLILVPSVQAALALCEQSVPEQTDVLMKAVWPGPVTLICKAGKNVPQYMQAPNGTLALRVPKHDYLSRFLAISGPLFSTSANLAGQAVPERIDQLEASIVEHVACVVEGHKGQAQASTIIDCTANELVLVRAGAMSVEEIEKKSGLRIKRVEK
jgi:L-threonylcarbamoyladenylate synthase